MVDQEPSNAELYRILLKLDKTINGNGQPGIRIELTQLQTEFRDHRKQHAIGGFTRKQVVAYGGLALTFVGLVAGFAAKLA